MKSFGGKSQGKRALGRDRRECEDNIKWILNRQGPKAFNSPPTSAELRNAWSYTPASSFVFMTCCLSRNNYFPLYRASIPVEGYAK